jgi:ABC-type antimicrobial peptide transport system permease subunit
MIRSYLNIAWRNISKNKMYSFINIGGLAVGMAVAMLIGLWVYDDVNYNHSHDNYPHIAQVYKRFTTPADQKVLHSTTLAQPVATTLADKYSHLFKNVVVVWWETDYTIGVGERNFNKMGQFVEDGFIEMFSLKMLKGDNNSLHDQQAIIISESTARALFGEKDPINQTLKLHNRIDVIVKGVYEDVANNSIFGAIDFFGNFENLKANNPRMKANETNWDNNAHRIYAQTQDNVNIERASEAIHNLYQNDAPGDEAQTAKKYNTSVELFPMKDWYLYSEFKEGYPVTGRITFVILFSVVGVFVLLLACINFMNLSTARSEKRAKEVGVRKTMGSMKSQLVNQFLSESFLVVLVSFVVALGIVLLSLSPFNELAEKKIQLPFTNIYFWLLSAAFLLITSFLSGLYPAFYLSSFQPVKVLKGTIRLGKYSSLPRKVLVVTQVTVSVVLIIGTVIVYQQIQYAQNRPVGYDREGLIRIPLSDPEFKMNDAMKEEMLRSGVAVDAALSSSPVTTIWDNLGGFTWKGKNPEAESSFSFTAVTEDYGKTIQWKILQGRDFSKQFATDVDAVIINKAAAKYMGLENPVGEYITWQWNQRSRLIIGVVEDVIAMSPYEPVSPGLYWLENDRSDVMSQMQVRLNPHMSVKEALSKIESIQSRLVPAAVFTYSFVDEDYGVKFNAEQRVGKLASLFAVLAIFISCLGLFGLSSFVAEQKTKEIGVRKVVGASIYNIWSLLSKEFVMLVLIAFVIAVPVAYYYLNRWLLTYNYHTDVRPVVFVYSGLGVLAITLVTVSFQSIKAAIANPIKSLRSE